MPWILFLFSELLILSGASHIIHFGYKDHEVTRWHKNCLGTHQSPVKITTLQAIPLAIPALEIVGFHNLIPRPVVITNNGHSVELTSFAKGYGKIFGALLEGEYEVEGIHFHWGSTDSKGSEHYINGVRFPIEMHIVTRSSKYNTVKEALNHSDGLAVMAFFYHVREDDNRHLEPILKELEMVRPDGSRVHLSHSFTLASLLPRDTDVFYTYRGSLTTPPCSQAVTWLVFPDPMPISFNQLKKFRNLSSGKGRLFDNFRAPQKLGTRKIFVRRTANEFNSYQNIYYNVSSPVFWGTDEEVTPHPEAEEVTTHPDAENL